MGTETTFLTKEFHGSTRNLLTIFKLPSLSPALAFSFRFLAAMSLILFVLTPDAYSAITTSRSCSQTDIQAAVNSANTGDTVQVPAGNCPITGTINIPAGITIAGAGENQTILTEAGASTLPLLSVNCSNGQRAIVSGITLIGTGDGVTRDQGLELKGNCQDFRVFDSTFEKFGAAGLTIRGNARGVVDHCRFVKNISDLGYGVLIYGDGTYPPLQLGTENAVFVEDSYIEGSRHAIASNNGTRYVFRYNQIVENRTGNQAIDAHGKSSWPRGTRSYEIYNNSINNSIQSWAGAGIRGGDGVIFNNTINDTNNPIMLWNDSSDTRYGGCTTYPCPDQIRELHIWNNTADGSSVRAQIRGDVPPGILLEDRDYFHFARPGYTPFTYPHPLTLQFEDSQPPARPQGLRILP